MLLTRHQNAGQNHDIKIGNRCFENVAQFRYLRKTIRNQNLIQEEIKRRLNSSNACYHSVQNLLSSRLLDARNVARMRRRGMHIGYWWESRKKGRPLGRPRRRWVSNIKMDLRGIGCNGMDWIDLAQDRDRWRALVNTLMNLRVP
ncbi:hypothetical protein B7P43_G14701 [Cryptotermes secundus]|uniref:Uncharacterized protein n=1 Tax=Cryptotermes secundus TaxID=105785 RepID=A0A2J7QIV1_9NEOP|nr:hypothetical protein B7P43_G14701 [Cryptotermes secundus]